MREALNRLVRAGRARDDEDRGAATIFVIGLSLALFAMAGLVVDGGLAINARAEAADVAEQTARAGAQSINVDLLRTSNVVEIERGGATTRAGAFFGNTSFAAKGGTIETLAVAGDEITVTVAGTYETKLLNIINFDSFLVRATATARPAVGIDAEL